VLAPRWEQGGFNLRTVTLVPLHHLGPSPGNALLGGVTLLPLDGETPCGLHTYLPRFALFPWTTRRLMSGRCSYDASTPTRFGLTAVMRTRAANSPGWLGAPPHLTISDGFPATVRLRGGYYPFVIPLPTAV